MEQVAFAIDTTSLPMYYFLYYKVPITYSNYTKLLKSCTNIHSIFVDFDANIGYNYCRGLSGLLRHYRVALLCF